MFERAQAVLKEKGLNPKSFEMQCAVYRDYDVGTRYILQSSPW
jgi:hypothetical protein